MYKYILFDLDGTIIESGPGIMNSVEYSLKKFGINVADKNSLRRFIGPPLKVSFMEFYGFNEEDAELAVKYYREYYAEKGIFECEIYPGIRELIYKLYEAGKKIILATSKPEHFAKLILEHFSLDKYFELIAGVKMNDLKSEKAAIIQYIFETLKITNTSEVLMIGDRKHDIIGAHKTGIKCAAVLFGYGWEEEFLEFGADYIISNANQIWDICFHDM